MLQQVSSHHLLLVHAKIFCVVDSQRVPQPHALSSSPLAAPLPSVELDLLAKSRAADPAAVARPRLRGHSLSRGERYGCEWIRTQAHLSHTSRAVHSYTYQLQHAHRNVSAGATFDASLPCSVLQCAMKGRMVNNMAQSVINCRAGLQCFLNVQVLLAYMWHPGVSAHELTWTFPSRLK
jgi:hypothetical protein